MRELMEGAAGARQARRSNAAAHGTARLRQDPDLVRALVEWFQLTPG